MKHEHVIDQDLIGRYRLGQLPPAEAEGFETHLIGCRECQSLLAVDERLAAGMRALAVQEAPSTTYARRWRASLPLAAAAVLMLAVGSTAALWFRGGPEQASLQAELPVYQLALSRGSEPQATVLRIPSHLVWYALEFDTPPVAEDCCRIVIEDADGAMVWQGESPLARDSNTVRVLFSRSFVDSGSYRIVLYTADSTRLVEHQVQIELTR